MAIIGFEVFRVESEFMTLDTIVWKRYRQRAIGIFEKTLDANPQLSFSNRTTPFIPVGTFIRVPIDPSLIIGLPPVLKTDSLWTDVKGYSV